MKIVERLRIVTAVSLALALSVAWASSARAQGPPTSGFPNVVSALRATPGCMGVETGQTSGGKRVIFAWFESKQTLVDWFHGDVHQRAMRAVFPNVSFDRQPLPDLPDDSGPILTIVSVKFGEAPASGATSPTVVSIGIELYSPLPGGVAVGGRFAPETVKVRGLREFDMATAQGRPR